MRTLKWLFICIVVPTFVFAQPEHPFLLYEHSLMNNSLGNFSILTNQGGEFIANSGWQATTDASQLFITLPEPLPVEGSMTIDVTHFDPDLQSVDGIKQQIINMYSHVYTDNKDIMYTDGSWWNVRTGNVSSDSSNSSGIRFFAAPQGILTRVDTLLLSSINWDLNEIYPFKFTWTSDQIYIFLDDQPLAVLPFSGQVEQFRHILLGRDNLIYGYAGQAGPIYSNLKIYTETPQSTTDPHPPVVENILTLKADRLFVKYDQAVTNESATETTNYEIDQTNTVLSATLSDDHKNVTLDLIYPLSEGSHTFIVNDIAAQRDTSLVLNNYSTTFMHYNSFAIENLSKLEYRIAARNVGDSIYIDRSYVYTALPTELTLTNWIITANNDKEATGTDFLSFSINKDAHVWLGFDDSMLALPNWLNDWESTVYDAQTTDASFHFYVKYYRAGDVVLGGNYGDQSSSMYLIAVIPHTQSGPDIEKPSPPMNLKVSTPSLK